MIEIRIQNDGVTIVGHAGYASPGKDIVCAAVSALFQTLVESLEEMTKAEINHDMTPGNAYIKIGNLSGTCAVVASILIDSFVIGVSCIEADYKQFVHVIDQRQEG